MPSYSAVLVYKLAQTDNPVIDFENANEDTADLGKTKIEAYIVFDANLIGDYGVNTQVGPDGATAVLLFKNDKQYMLVGGSDPNSGVFIETYVSYGSYDSIAPFTATGKRSAGYTLLFVNIFDDEISLGVYAFDLYGKNTSAEIGLADKFSLAKSLKGFNEVTITEDGDLYGFGTAKLTLNSKYTKLANENGLTVSQTVDAITGDLKNFREMQTVPR